MYRWVACNVCVYTVTRYSHTFIYFSYLHYLLQKFLHIHNKPGFKSFYEEMMSRQEQQQQQQQLIKKQKEDKQVILLLWYIQSCTDFELLKLKCQLIIRTLLRLFAWWESKDYVLINGNTSQGKTQDIFQVLEFSQWCWWRSKSHGMLYHVSGKYCVIFQRSVLLPSTGWTFLVIYFWTARCWWWRQCAET